MKKLSKAQQSIVNKYKQIFEVIDRYETYEDFFDNSKGEQNYFTTAYRCNAFFNTSDKYKERALKEWKEYEASFFKAKNERIIGVYAKTETVKALEKAGYIRIVKEAQWKGDFETVQFLTF